MSEELTAENVRETLLEAYGADRLKRFNIKDVRAGVLIEFEEASMLGVGLKECLRKGWAVDWVDTMVENEVEIVLREFEIEEEERTVVEEVPKFQ